MKKYIIMLLLFIPILVSANNNSKLEIPMTIFGNINSGEHIINIGSQLSLYDQNHIIVGEYSLTSTGSYGTNDLTSELQRLNINSFTGTGKVILKDNNYIYSDIKVIEGGYGCNSQLVFQSSKLCKYNLDLTNAIKKSIIQIGKINLINSEKITSNSFSIIWNKLNNIDGFIVNNKTTNQKQKIVNNYIDFNNLLSNKNYIIEVYPYKGDTIGDPKIITVRTLSQAKEVINGIIEEDISNIDDFGKDEHSLIVKDTKTKTIIKYPRLDVINNIKTETNLVITKKPISIDNNNLTDSITFIPNNELDDDDKKIILSLPKGIKATSTGVIINPPIKLTRNDDIKNDIDKNLSNKTVIINSAIEIPTNIPVNFNGDIELCMPANGKTSTNGLKIYSTNDGINWNMDSNTNSLIIKSDILCFKTNHLTSFVSLVEVNTSTNSSSSAGGGGGGGGGGGTSYPQCLDNQLICKSVAGSTTLFKWYKKPGFTCIGGKLGKTCEIINVNNVVNTDTNIIVFKTNKFQKIDKIISKKIKADIKKISIYSQFSISILENLENYKQASDKFKKSLYLFEENYINKNKTEMKNILIDIKKSYSEMNYYLKNYNNLIKENWDIESKIISHKKINLLKSKNDLTNKVIKKIDKYIFLKDINNSIIIKRNIILLKIDTLISEKDIIKKKEIIIDIKRNIKDLFSN